MESTSEYRLKGAMLQCVYEFWEREFEKARRALDRARLQFVNYQADHHGIKVGVRVHVPRGIPQAPCDGVVEGWDLSSDRSVEGKPNLRVFLLDTEGNPSDRTTRVNHWEVILD